MSHFWISPISFLSLDFFIWIDLIANFNVDSRNLLSMESELEHQNFGNLYYRLNYRYFLVQGAITEMQIFLNSCHLSWINTTETCNMAMEPEFTQLSTLFTSKTAAATKKVYRPVYAMLGGFPKISPIQVLVNLRLLSSLWKLLWSMTINLPKILIH